MARKTEERHDALRDKLVDLAQAQIARDGIAALRVRDLAAQAGCSVGAIYTVFPDLTALALAVNARTFEALEAALTQSLKGTLAEEPTEHLIALATGYLAFAAQNPLTWKALFEINLTPETPAPDWYRNQMQGLFGLILAPVQRLFPDLDDAQAMLMAQALFSSVHGIVVLGLDEASAGVPRAQIGQMLAMVLGRMK